jgi:hypothetical protein
MFEKLFVAGRGCGCAPHGLNEALKSGAVVSQIVAGGTHVAVLVQMPDHANDQVHAAGAIDIGFTSDVAARSRATP